VKSEAGLLPLKIEAVGVFNRNSNCWEVPRSGITPTDELVPCRNPCIAFAVDDSD